MTMGAFLIQLVCYLLLTAFVHALSRGGLQWVRVNVPQYRVPNETALLQCDYDLGNETLYAVKWYKEHEEFYRFVQKAKPQSTSYRVDGVIVDESKSDSKRVVLKHVNWKTSGLFRCEVSAERPSFASAQSEARMEVVSLPEEDPKITGVEQQYQIGEEINLNCTSGKSHPTSEINWYINEQKVSSPSALFHYPVKHFRHGLTAATVGLRFTLSNPHFTGGSMRIRCVATMPPIIREGDRDVSPRQSPLVKDAREALLLVKSSSAALIISFPLLIFSFLVFVKT